MLSWPSAEAGVVETACIANAMASGINFWTEWIKDASRQFFGLLANSLAKARGKSNRKDTAQVTRERPPWLSQILAIGKAAGAAEERLLARQQGQAFRALPQGDGSAWRGSKAVEPINYSQKRIDHSISNRLIRG